MPTLTLGGSVGGVFIRKEQGSVVHRWTECASASVVYPEERLFRMADKASCIARAVVCRCSGSGCAENER